MTFSVRTIEVDGTFDNPFVVVTILLWAVLLSVVTFQLVAWALRPHREAEARPRVRLLVGGAAVAVLFVATPVVQPIIGHLLYVLEYMRRGEESPASVGFWGGPSVLPSWLAAVLCGVLSARRSIRRRLLG